MALVIDKQSPIHIVSTLHKMISGNPKNPATSDTVTLWSKFVKKLGEVDPENPLVQHIVTSWGVLQTCIDPAKPIEPQMALFRAQLETVKLKLEASESPSLEKILLGFLAKKQVSDAWNYFKGYCKQHNLEPDHPDLIPLRYLIKEMAQELHVGASRWVKLDKPVEAWLTACAYWDAWACITGNASPPPKEAEVMYDEVCMLIFNNFGAFSDVEVRKMITPRVGYHNIVKGFIKRKIDQFLEHHDERGALHFIRSKLKHPNLKAMANFAMAARYMQELEEVLPSEHNRESLRKAEERMNQIDEGIKELLATKWHVITLVAENYLKEGNEARYQEFVSKAKAKKEATKDADMVKILDDALNYLQASKAYCLIIQGKTVDGFALLKTLPIQCREYDRWMEYFIKHNFIRQAQQLCDLMPRGETRRYVKPLLDKAQFRYAAYFDGPDGQIFKNYMASRPAQEADYILMDAVKFFLLEYAPMQVPLALSLAKQIRDPQQKLDYVRRVCMIEATQWSLSQIGPMTALRNLLNLRAETSFKLDNVEGPCRPIPKKDPYFKAILQEVALALTSIGEDGLHGLCQEPWVHAIRDELIQIYFDYIEMDDFMPCLILINSILPDRLSDAFKTYKIIISFYESENFEDEELEQMDREWAHLYPDALKRCLADYLLKADEYEPIFKFAENLRGRWSDSAFSSLYEYYAVKAKQDIADRIVQNHYSKAYQRLCNSHIMKGEYAKAMALIDHHFKGDEALRVKKDVLRDCLKNNIPAFKGLVQTLNSEHRRLIVQALLQEALTPEAQVACALQLPPEKRDVMATSFLQTDKFEEALLLECDLKEAALRVILLKREDAPLFLITFISFLVRKNDPKLLDLALVLFHQMPKHGPVYSFLAQSLATELIAKGRQLEIFDFEINEESLRVALIEKFEHHPILWAVVFHRFLECIPLEEALSVIAKISSPDYQNKFYNALPNLFDRHHEKMLHEPLIALAMQVPRPDIRQQCLHRIYVIDLSWGNQLHIHRTLTALHPEGSVELAIKKQIQAALQENALGQVRKLIEHLPEAERAPLQAALVEAYFNAHQVDQIPELVAAYGYKKLAAFYNAREKSPLLYYMLQAQYRTSPQDFEMPDLDPAVVKDLFYKALAKGELDFAGILASAFPDPDQECEINLVKASLKKDKLPARSPQQWQKILSRLLELKEKKLHDDICLRLAQQHFNQNQPEEAASFARQISKFSLLQVLDKSEAQIRAVVGIYSARRYKRPAFEMIAHKHLSPAVREKLFNALYQECLQSGLHGQIALAEEFAYKCYPAQATAKKAAFLDRVEEPDDEKVYKTYLAIDLADKGGLILSKMQHPRKEKLKEYFTLQHELPQVRDNLDKIPDEKQRLEKARELIQEYSEQNQLFMAHALIGIYFPAFQNPHDYYFDAKAKVFEAAYKALKWGKMEELLKELDHKALINYFIPGQQIAILIFLLLRNLNALKEKFNIADFVKDQQCLHALLVNARKQKNEALAFEIAKGITDKPTWEALFPTLTTDETLNLARFHEKDNKKLSEFIYGLTEFNAFSRELADAVDDDPRLVPEMQPLEYKPVATRLV